MTKKKVLITGVTGFVASHMVELLLTKDVEIYGTKRWRSPMDNISHLKDKINFVDMELRDYFSVKSAIETVKPDIIFHLAAQSFVPAGTSMPQDTFCVNAIGTLNLLEAVRAAKIDPIIHIASTADVYGPVTADKGSVNEETLPRAPNLYAVSKMSAEEIALQYHDSYGLKTIVSRMLTHTGPRRGETFVESAFAKQIAEIECGKIKPEMKVGNLSAVRTFLDIRDAVNAYWLLSSKCKAGEVYNICGTESMEIQKLLDMLLSYSKVKGIKVSVDKRLFRPNDPPRAPIDITKFVSATGWKPMIEIKDTVKDLLDYWRKGVGI